MKIRNIEDAEEFLSVIDNCKGSVMMITENGDQLNLKSKLCQFVSLSKMFSTQEKIPGLEVIAADPEDANRLMSYMLYGKNMIGATH